MAKTKTPFFGLDSQGSIGNTLTTQRHAGGTMVRSKPTPGYRRTLPQLYQRWLYEDYAYLWTKQSAATRAEYRTAGSRFHLTAFQYWMKVMLLTFPDLLGWWRMDDPAGAVLTDTSPLGNNGVIFGASPIPGIIDGQYHFDGINDQVTIAPSTPFDLTSRLISMECLVYFEGNTGDAQCITSTATQFDHFAFIRWAGTQISFDLRVNGIRNILFVAATAALNTQYHLCATYNAITGIGTMYINGIQDCQLAKTIGIIDPYLNPIFGSRLATLWTHARIDNIILRNRILDPTEVLRHSLRRYPS